MVRGRGPKEVANSPLHPPRSWKLTTSREEARLVGGAKEKVPPSPGTTPSPTLSTGQETWNPMGPYSSHGV